MSSKGVIKILAGPASIIAILMLVLLSSLAGSELLASRSQLGQTIGADIALAKAGAVAEALLDSSEPQRSINATGETFTTRHLRGALTSAPSGEPVDPFATRAIDELRRDPSTPYFRFSNKDGAFYLQYAVSDRSDGVLLIDLPLMRERAAIGRALGQLYVSGTVLSYLLIGLLIFGMFSLRHFLRDLIATPESERREIIAAGLNEADANGRRNLLPWMLLLCAGVFVLDISDSWETVIGIGYVLAVTLGLSSNRPWHIGLVAAFGALCLLLSPLISDYDIHWWAYLQNQAVTLFALIVTALFGSASMSKSRAEARALADAAQSKMETSEPRVALERAEAAEAARRAMLERVSLANGAAGISTWEWNLKSDVVKFDADSPFAERMGGRTTYLSKQQKHVHIDSRDGYRQAFIGALERPAGSDASFAYRYRFVDDMADGTPRYIQLHGRVLRSVSGRVYGVLGVDWEVTEEERSRREIARQAEQLSEAQERFQRAISGTQDALFEFDFKTGSVWHSPRFLEMLGYASEDELPKGADGLAQVIHPEDNQRLIDVTHRHLTNNEPYDIEYRVLRKNGEPLWVRARGRTQRDASGAPLILAGSISDITESRAAREAIVRAAEEAEAASFAKSSFLATMSHEIRTPMNGVIGMTGLLLDSGLDRVQRDYAETIRASADSLLTILNDILDFSKIEAGKLDIESIDLDLTANVDDVGSIMAFQAAAKGLELVVNVRPEVPTRVLGDPQRIRQCLLNLVGNAIKFTHSGEVVLEVCSLGRQQGKALVHFEIRDTGIGISHDAIQNLFQPFTQADSSTTRKFGGTGLGLSIVRKLVEMMGGQAGAQSEPDKGSTFWFTLPLEQVLDAETTLLPTKPERGGRILLVDDNETNRRVLSSQMVHAGYNVETAACAAAALTVLRQPNTAFDFVVLDYQMPDMDGAMLGEQIMRSKDIARTRLVLLTSLDRSGDMQRFADIGFSAYLTKPVRTRELLDCLHKALSHQAQDWHLRSQPIITRGTLIATDNRQHYAGKVLLVEDNAINQRVARRFLERLGCEVHVVADGAQAVDAHQRDTYGLVLMDMQMPVMDGVEATRRIRELELDGLRTPIVALTANAMMGTLERCLDAGMDDYLTKPLDISRLQDVLDRFMNSSEKPPADAPRPVKDAAPARIETSVRARLDDIAGGDAEFVLELINAFVMGGEEALCELNLAVQANDRGAITQAAHKLKGASANLHVEGLAKLAGDLEENSKAGKQSDPQDVARLVLEFKRVAELLRGETGEQVIERAS